MFLLPSHCPYALSDRIPSDEIATIPCCRAERTVSFYSRTDEPPLCACPGEEVYRFAWLSSFDGFAYVRITREGEEITLKRKYFRLGANPRPVSLALSTAEWQRFKSALEVASFWLLDPIDRRLLLDGAQWTIEGRIADLYHAVEQQSPEKGTLHDLGRLFFDFAGPPLSSVRLY